MKNIPTNSLIEKYLPADYVDSYSREIACNQKITPEKFRNLAFNQLPKWIDWLMNYETLLQNHWDWIQRVDLQIWCPIKRA